MPVQTIFASTHPIYRRNRLQPAQSCVAPGAKVANIQRHIQAVEDQYRELVDIQDRLDFANKAYTFARLIKDTSVAILDLAGAIAGGQVARTASLGTVAIDSAATLSELAHGQASPAETALRTASGAAAAVNPKNAGGRFAAAKARQVIGMANRANEMRNAPTRDAATAQAMSGGVDLMADTVLVITETAKKVDGDVYDRVGRVANLIKAMNAYRDALNGSLEQRLETVYDIRSTKQVYLHQNKLMMTRLRKDLAEAMAELTSCLGEVTAAPTGHIRPTRQPSP